MITTPVFTLRNCHAGPNSAIGVNESQTARYPNSDTPSQVLQCDGVMATVARTLIKLIAVRISETAVDMLPFANWRSDASLDATQTEHSGG